MKKLDLTQRVVLGVGVTGTVWGLWLWKERGFAPDPSRPPDTWECAILGSAVAIVVLVVCTGWLGERIRTELKELGEKIDRLKNF